MKEYESKSIEELRNEDYTSYFKGTQTGTTKEQLKLTFSRDELRNALLPPLEKLYAMEPEALPFRYPVDPQALGIPDYFEIIKNPMDLTTIKKKLDEGTYKEPWEFVDDVWQMFENAWTYNRKQSRVYKYCSKVNLHSQKSTIFSRFFAACDEN